MSKWLTIGSNGNQAYLAVPESGTGAGVLVLHAWWGLTSVFTDVCDRLAAQGYVALAPGMFSGGATTESIAEAEALVTAHNREPEKTEATLQAAVEQLRTLPEVTGTRIGVIGFSMGAFWALELSLSRPDDVGAVVAFYGTGGGDFGTARAAYLGHFAEHDDFEPLEDVRALEAAIREAGRDVTFHVYPDTGHWFFESNRPDAYIAAAADLAWERTLTFLKEQLT